MRTLIAVLVVLAATPALAGELALFDAQGLYRGRLERSQDGGEIDRFDAQGLYAGRYQRTSDGWDAFNADGTYWGRIEHEPGMGEDAPGR